ncbi:putative conserved membrane protein [Mycobacterium kansasii 732]|nr:putative conserved membrane protein [Mycobacterium kansasii 732]
MLPFDNGSHLRRPERRLGESLPVLGWNMAVSNLRWSGDYVLVDVDASPSDPHAPHAKPEDVRYGLYGALSHPLESTGLGSCDDAMTKVRDIAKPLSAPPDRLTGTVCLGPLTDRSAVRGVYTYSPHDRIANTAAAYPAAFPVGMLPTNQNDTGLVVKTTSLSAWRADGAPVTKTQLGDPAAFTGNGYMLLGMAADALATRYRDDSAARGGPMMLLAAPTLPGRGLSPACATYGASVLILPDASRDAVHIDASLCTQGEINQALLYATVAIVGTHAAVWTSR